MFHVKPRARIFYRFLKLWKKFPCFCLIFVGDLMWIDGGYVDNFCAKHAFRGKIKPLPAFTALFCVILLIKFGFTSPPENFNKVELLLKCGNFVDKILKDRAKMPHCAQRDFAPVPLAGRKTHNI